MATKSHDDDGEVNENEKDKNGDRRRRRGTSSSNGQRRDVREERKSRDDADLARKREGMRKRVERTERKENIEVDKSATPREDDTRKKRREDDDNDYDGGARERRRASNEAVDAKTSTSTGRRKPLCRQSSDDLDMELLKRERDQRRWASSSDGKLRKSTDDVNLKREGVKGREKREGREEKECRS